MASQNPTSTHERERVPQPKTAGPNRRPLILVLLILSLLFAVSYTGRLGSLAGIRAEIAYKEQQIADARQRQAALLDEQRYVKSAGYLDDVARGEMGMGQRDEAAVVVVKNKSGDTETVEAPVAPAEEGIPQASATPIWQQWLALFVQPVSYTHLTLPTTSP